MKRNLYLQIPLFIATRTVLNSMVRIVYPFLPVFGRGLGVDPHLLALGVTLRSAAGIFGPFLAVVSDLRGRKTGMLLGLLLFIAGTGLVVFRPSLPTFILALILTLLGNLTFIPSMQAYLGDRIPYRRRGLVIGLTEFGWSLSFIVGMPLIGLVIARQGWQAPFAWLAGLGCLVLLVMMILIPNDPPPAGRQPRMWGNLRSIFTHPIAPTALLIGLGISAANELISLVFGVWLEEAFAVKIAALAAASAVIGFAELSGESFASLISDRLGKQRAVATGLILNILACLALPWLGRNLVGALVSLFLFYLTFEFSIVCYIPLMTEVLPALRGTLMAAFFAGTASGRALGSLVALPLYELNRNLLDAPGILVSVLAASALNLAALLALRTLRKVGEAPSAPLAAGTQD